MNLRGTAKADALDGGREKEAADGNRNRGPGGAGLSVATERFNEVISIRHVLTEKLLGLSDFGVPHLKLIRTEEVHHTLPKLVTMG